eukprot:4642492-Alexandrium_andersonii.AAC.1
MARPTRVSSEIASRREGSYRPERRSARRWAACSLDESVAHSPAEAPVSASPPHPCWRSHCARAGER